MNTITTCQMVEFRDQGWKVFLHAPGFCESNIGPEDRAINGAKLAAEGSRLIITLLDRKREDETGELLHHSDEYSQ
jgi:hypothetical protein